MACHQKHKEKNKPLQTQKCYLLQSSCFLFQNPFKRLQKTGPQRVPPCRPLHLQLKIGTSICNKKQPFGLTCIFSSFFFFWLWLNGFQLWLNAFQKHKQSKPLQTQKNITFSKTAVFNQNPMEIPSEPIRKQMFLNQGSGFFVPRFWPFCAFGFFSAQKVVFEPVLVFFEAWGYLLRQGIFWPCPRVFLWPLLFTLRVE